MSPVIPPSLIEAARSGDVRGANLAVYIELHEWLDADNRVLTLSQLRAKLGIELLQGAA